MRIGLVMDASCDLPQDYVTRHRITVLPIRIDVDGASFTDRRDARETQRFFDDAPRNPRQGTEVTPASPDVIQALFLDELVAHFDCVFCLTVAAAHSALHANATTASFRVLRNYRSIREEAGRPGPFLLRVLDTQNLSAGAAVVVAEAVHVIDGEHTPAQIRERLNSVSAQANAFLLPREPHPRRTRGHERGERRAGLLGATLGSAFNMLPILRSWRGQTRPIGRTRGFEAGAQILFKHTAERIREGLLVPTVAVSYGGPLFDLRGLPGYEELSELCDTRGVELLASPMSITGMVTLGEGALAVGFACEDYTPTL